ncbi:hypothetical protein Ga0100230_009020 [Opitutaceae bacterium TAV3]|nr:hypothetical protein Ga0100230_009020 [Opitutaceae bacterium TAV3]
MRPSRVSNVIAGSQRASHSRNTLLVGHPPTHNTRSGRNASAASALRKIASYPATPYARAHASGAHWRNGDNTSSNTGACNRSAIARNARTSTPTSGPATINARSPNFALHIPRSTFRLPPPPCRSPASSPAKNASFKTPLVRTASTANAAAHPVCSATGGNGSRNTPRQNHPRSPAHPLSCPRHYTPCPR